MLILSCIVAGYAGYEAALRYIPIKAMSAAEARIAARIGSFNQMSHPPRPTANSRSVVRPSPDLLYSACVYDLSGGPVKFTGTVPLGSYWSLSFFAHNTDNYFVVNDSELGGQAFQFVLVKENQPPPESVGMAEIIYSPSKTGIVIQRVFVDKDERVDELDQQRKSTRCAPFSG